MLTTENKCKYFVKMAYCLNISDLFIKNSILFLQIYAFAKSNFFFQKCRKKQN